MRSWTVHRSHGQTHLKCAAHPWLADNRDFTSMTLHNLLHDSQTDSGPAGCSRARAIPSVEPLKNQGDILLGNSDSRVLNCEERSAVVLMHAHLHLAACRGELERVGEQVHQGLVQPIWISESSEQSLHQR